MSNAKRRAANPPGVRLPRNERPRSMKASLLVAAAVTGSLAAQTPARPAPLPAPVRPVVDTYHGVQVIDSYRWLERWDDSEVKAWTAAQNTYTHEQLDALPFMAALRARVQTVGADTHPRWTDVKYRHGLLFAIKQQPPQGAADHRRDAIGRRSRVRADRGRSSGARSKRPHGDRLLRAVADGTRVAVSLSVGGTEDGDVARLRRRHRRASCRTSSRASTAARPAAASRGTRTAAGSSTRATRGRASGPDADRDFYQQVYFHKLGGTPRHGRLRDRQGLSAHRRGGRHDQRRRAVPAGRRSTTATAASRRITSRPPAGGWRRLAGYHRRSDHGRRGRPRRRAVPAVAQGRAARRILRLPRSNSPTLADAKVVVPESDGGHRRDRR